MAPIIQMKPEEQGADLRLMQRIAAGDQAALATLYDRYSSVLYSVAKRVLSDTGAAEEILQDVFLQVWRNASRFDPQRGSLSGWLLVTTRNRAIDRLRRRTSQGPDPAPEELAMPGASLETSVAQDEMMARVKAVLGGLAPGQREALEMAYFEGLTHSEIAERSGEPLGTVKTRLRTALQVLKKALNP
ncbi:MAG: sigma-70 family RNA polymerase sigma factor [Terriglobia bacterium]